MSKLTAEQIVEVVSELIGYIEPYGSSQIDRERLDNQKKLEEVVDTLVWMLCKNTKYSERNEYSMCKIGDNARDFLGYLVTEYELNNFVRKEE